MFLVFSRNEMAGKCQNDLNLKRKLVEKNLKVYVSPRCKEKKKIEGKKKKKKKM